MRDEEGFHVGHVRVVAVTAKAVCVRLQNRDEIWFPLSQVHDDSEIFGKSEKDEEGELVVSEWIAKEKGLL